MEFFALQFILFLIAFILLNINGYGLRYSCLFFMPFYAMAILGLQGGVSTNIQPVHLFGSIFLAWFILSGYHFRKGETIRYLLILTPFIVSLIYNSFFFEPVVGWEIQGELRKGGKNITIKNSLSSTNITQLIYIIFGLVMACAYSSIELEKRKVKRIIDIVLVTVTVLGVLQVIAWYTGWHQQYKAVFNTTNAQMADQVFLYNWKRINACFQEPSYLGHFLFFTLSFYLLCFGYQAFLKSKPVWGAVAIGILSTATTFYAGFVVLLIYMYFVCATQKERMWYYIIGIIIVPIALYTGLDALVSYFDAKQTSTNNRFDMGWNVAWDGIAKSPFFGLAYGTHRPLFIYTQFLSAIGVFGTIFVIYAFLQGKTNKNMRHYLLLVVGIGIATFEMTRHEMWIYFGLLSNRSLYRDNHYI